MEQSSVLEIMVTVKSDREVEVRWLRLLGRPNSSVYKALQETLDEIDGVELAYVGRYSAQVIVADHVASSETIAAQVEATLKDPDSEFRAAMRFHFAELRDLVVHQPGRIVKL
jgi:hypothetical protein